MRRKLTELERDNLRRVAKIRKAHAAEQNRLGRNDPAWPRRRKKLEAELLKAKPHLAEQKHCGLAEDSERPRQRVVCDNGVVLYSTWYKPPRTDADHRKAYEEARYLGMTVYP
jgi:hypothetical protein